MPRLGWVGARKRALVAEKGVPAGAQNQLEDRASVRAPSELLRVTQGAWKPSRACLRAREGRATKRQEGRSDREAESTLGERDPQGHSWEACEGCPGADKLLSATTQGREMFGRSERRKWVFLCMVIFLCPEGEILITITVYC